jgi:Acetyltransferase (GNAT) domain
VRSANGRPAVTSPVPRAVWESLLHADPGAVVTQSLAWHDALLAGGRYQDVSLLYEFPSGQQVLLPMVRPRHTPAWAATMASWPRDWGIGGPISPGGDVGPAEAAAVLADLAGRRTLATEIQLRHGTSDAWLSQASQFRVEECRLQSYVLSLAGGFERVWQDRFRGTARTAMRKAERAGLEVEVDRSGRLLPQFWELHEKSIQRWAAMQHEPAWLTRWRTTRATPFRMLESVAECFGTSCSVWLARSNGEPVAGLIVLSAGGYAKYWKGAMDKQQAGPLRANELLHRLAIQDACQRGCHFYDMGWTRPASPLAAFKEKLGATAHVAYTLRAERVPLQAARTAATKLAKRAIGFQDA